MDNLMLGCFLFVVYFSFFCVLFYDKKEVSNLKVDNTQNISANNIEQAIKEILKDDVFEDEEEDRETEVVETPLTLTETIFDFDTALPELDTLTCKVLRPIASELGIGIRHNKKVQPKEWLVKKIQEELDADDTGSVYQVILNHATNGLM